MKKTALIGLMLLIIIGVGIGWYFYSDKQGSFKGAKLAGSSGYAVSKTVRYSFNVRNTSDRVVEQAEFWTYAPVALTSTQKSIDIKATHTYELTTDEAGNQILLFKLKKLAPYGLKIITITAQLAMADEPNFVEENKLDSYLRSEKFIESDNANIMKVAESFNGSTPHLLAQQNFKWVADHVKHVGYIKDDLGALYALEKQKGDCTEFMYLFLALARASGIPARGIGGYVYPANAVLKSVDYHNWAEVYIDGAWRVVDPQNRVFMDKSSHYVAMRIFHHSENNVLNNTHRFLHSGDGIEVSMN